MTSDLTPRQKSVLDFIIAVQQKHRMAPTVREICAHLGLPGPAGIHRILGVLKDAGYIISEPGKKRSWRLSEEKTGKGIPLVSTIAAGVPLEAIENFVEELAVSPRMFGCDKYFGLRVSGDSMVEVHIQDGDLAIVRPQQRVENGEITAVTVDGTLPEATLKIVQWNRHSLSLVPANSALSPLILKGPQRKRVGIIGKLMGIIRRR